jgi:hypothetical protein
MSYQSTSSPSLVIRHTGQVFALTQAPVTIGRLSDNTIVLADPQVSRHHATITWQAGAFVIQDLGSANGTYVNQRRITGPQALRDGDVIQTGNTHFDVQLAPAAGEADRTMVGAAAAPDTGKRSALPIILGLLLAGIVIVGLGIMAILLLSGDRDRIPTVAIQSPPQDAQIALGNEIILQASAAGAPDIIRLELAVDDVLVGTSVSPDSEGTGSLTVSQPWSFGQTGPHVVSAAAYTASGETSAPTSVDVAVIDADSQVTPTATPSAGPTTSAPTVTPTSTEPQPDTPVPSPTPSTTPTSTHTPTPTATPSHTPTPTDTPTPTHTPTEPPPPVIQFWADDTTITAGDSTYLRWHVEHVQEIYLDGAPVTGPDGQQAISPATTTTYELRVTHAGGDETRSVTITVVPAIQTWTHAIKVLPNRAIYHLRLVAPGEIRVRAEWTGAQSDLALLINGPGQVGYYARRDGTSPLEVAYTVTAADLAAGDDWQVTVASFGIARADGTVRVIYPSGSSTPLSYEFAVDPGFGSAANVLVLRDAGSIEAQATWLPASAGLALIVNGPGQVGYYARQDGTSPLSVQYTVTPADLAHGDSWLVRLVAFSALTVEGNVSLTYP